MAHPTAEQTAASSPNELQFPLSDSNSSLIEHPSQQIMDSDTTSEDGLGYLSDSTYEIISQSSFQASDSEDDEAVNTPHDTDDAASVVSHATTTLSEDSDSDSDSDSDEADSPVQPQSQPQEWEQSFEEHRLRAEAAASREATVYTPDESEADDLLSIPSLNTSTVRASAVTSAGGSHSLEDWIKFQEPMTSVADGLLNVSEDAATQSGSTEQVDDSITLVHTLASHNLKLSDGPFRILYHGDASLKTSIVQKISQALRVSTWGEAKAVTGGDPSTAPVGVLLEVLECNCRRGMSFVPDTCQNFFDSSTDMSLAVFVHPQVAEPSKASSSTHYTPGTTDLELSLDLARRCHVPRIDIARHHHGSSVYRNMSYRPYGGVAVHCVVKDTILEKELPIIASPTVMPVDVETFLGLESVTLNRNLAKMFDHLQSTRRFTNAGPSAITRTLKSLGNELRQTSVDVYAQFKDLKTVIMTSDAAISLDKTRRSVQQGAVPFLKKFRMEIMHAITALLFCVITTWLLYSISTLLTRPALSVSNLSMPGFSSPVHALRTPYPVPKASSFEAMIEESLARSDERIVQVTTSSPVALATVHPETGLSIVTNASKSRSSWLTRTKDVPEPEWQLFHTNDSSRLLLKHRGQLPDLILVNMTMGRTDSNLIFSSANNLLYIPRGQAFMRTSLSRVDQSTVKLQLSPYAFCGSYNISVQAYPPKKGQHGVYVFVISEPCQESWLVRDARELGTAYTRMLQEVGDSASSRLMPLISSNSTRLPMEQVQAVLMHIPGQFEHLRQSLRSELVKADIPAKVQVASNILMRKLQKARIAIRADAIALRRRIRSELERLDAKIKADEEEREQSKHMKAAQKKLRTDAHEKTLQDLKQDAALRKKLDEEMRKKMRDEIQKARAIEKKQRKEAREMEREARTLQRAMEKKLKKIARSTEAPVIPIKKARSRAVVLKDRMAYAAKRVWQRFDHRLVRYRY